LNALAKAELLDALVHNEARETPALSDWEERRRERGRVSLLL
jgi:hypothetical protein